MITLDLRSGYHHIEIHPDHLRFLGFAWEFPWEVSGCLLHLTFLLNVLSRLRSIGDSTVLILLYFLMMAGRFTCAVRATNIWSDLRKSGFITNDEKSQMVSESSSRMVGDYMEHLLMASLPFLRDG